MRTPALVLVLACLAAGCPARPLDEAALREKESALNKLAASLESAVRFQDAPPSMGESQLLALAIKEDPAQLEPFRNLTVRVRRQEKLSSVLVCTADGARALWEDAGCTPPLDLRLWDKAPAACNFQLDLAKTCQ